MSGGFARKPGGSSLVQSTSARPATGGPGKQTLTERLPVPIQRSPSNAQLPELDRMGEAFGADFSTVRLHQGDGVAEAHGAHALAHGDDIHFAAGRGPQDRALLGHELAHVVQQREGRVAAPQGKDGAIVADPALESEADRAGAAVARGEPVPSEARARGGSSRVSGAIQLFDSVGEHKRAGDEGSGGLEYVWAQDPAHAGTMKPGEAQDRLPTRKTKLPRDKHGEEQWCQPNQFEFRLTHGDIVMLSGDLFDPRDTAPDAHGKPQPVKDSLFKLAATPSRDPGRQLLTQDEIIYAIYRENPTDIRFNNQCTVEQPGGGPWALYPRRFSPEVKRSVDNRFLRLAAENRDHFNQPDERQNGPGGERDSSGGAYHALHENAILQAYRAALHGDSAAEAFARDAAAQHFLTDAFSAGHIRTRRASIIAYWNARYPHFFQSVLRTMERTIAHALNRQSALVTYVVPESTDLPIPLVGKSFRSRVHEDIAALLKDAPPVTFGDTLGKIAHDVDNETGLWVVNDLGQKWRAYGDGHMYQADPDNRTPEMTRLAVKLSVDDISTAQVLGTIHAGGPEHKRDEVLNEVRDRTAAPAVAGLPRYGGEQIVPRPDPDRVADNGAQNTTASTFDDLWDLPIRSDNDKVTYGARIRQAMQPGGAFYDLLKEKGDGLTDDNHGTNPRKAFFDGFLDPFSRNVRQWMTQILADAG